MNVSAKAAKPTKGDKWLRAVLVEVACAIAHTKHNYLAAQFHRFARRKRAACEALAQRFALQQLSDQVRRSVMLADVVDAEDEKIPRLSAIPCTTCSGSGNCARCGGKGRRLLLKCGNCSGSGRCDVCGGGGFVMRSDQE